MNTQQIVSRLHSATTATVSEPKAGKASDGRTKHTSAVRFADGTVAYVTFYPPKEAAPAPSKASGKAKAPVTPGIDYTELAKAIAALSAK